MEGKQCEDTLTGTQNDRTERATERHMGDCMPVNIPIQMFAVTDRGGRMSPLYFRFESEAHTIERIQVDEILSRDELNFVGIREKRFICKAAVEGQERLLEIRYSVESQKWKIFQFLS